MRTSPPLPSATNTLHTFLVDACSVFTARLTEGWCTRQSGIPMTLCDPALYSPSSTPRHLETGRAASFASVLQPWGSHGCITCGSKSDAALAPPRARAPVEWRLSMKELGETTTTKTRIQNKKNKSEKHVTRPREIFDFECAREDVRCSYTTCFSRRGLPNGGSIFVFVALVWCIHVAAGVRSTDDACVSSSTQHL